MTTLAGVKARVKQVPFNVALPWGDSIAQYIGTTVTELKENLPKDHALQGLVGSTCAMVRDLAAKQLIQKNSKAALTLSDICQGVGPAMHDGLMVNTGACTMHMHNAKGAIQMGDGANDFAPTCKKKEGDVYLKQRKFFGPPGMVPLTPLERLKNYNRIGQSNTSTLGAPDLADAARPTGLEGLDLVFLQKQSNSSADDLPNQSNPALSGKGQSYNSAPTPRWNNNPNKTAYHVQGYSEKPVEAEGAAADEAAALGAQTLKVPIIRTDQKLMVKKMDVPEWVCSMLCAGLNIEELLDGQAINDPGEEPPIDRSPQMTNPHMNSEEGMHLNTQRQGVDSRVQPQGANTVEQVSTPSKLYDGTQECERAAPTPTDCIEKGAEITHWIMERIINKESFCDYEKESCVTLFA